MSNIHLNGECCEDFKHLSGAVHPRPHLVHVNVASEVVGLDETSLLRLLFHVPQVDKVDFARKLVDHGDDIVFLPAGVAADAHCEPVVAGIVGSWNLTGAYKQVDI